MTQRSWRQLHSQAIPSFFIWFWMLKWVTEKHSEVKLIIIIIITSTTAITIQDIPKSLTSCALSINNWERKDIHLYFFVYPEESHFVLNDGHWMLRTPSQAQPVFSPNYPGVHLENVKCWMLITPFHCVIFVQTWFCVMSLKPSGKCSLPPRKLKYRIKMPVNFLLLRNIQTQTYDMLESSGVLLVPRATVFQLILA